MTTDGKDLPDLAPDALRNRASWDAYSDEYQATHAGALDKAGGLTWGASEVPESALHVLGTSLTRTARMGQTLAR
jgi:hypothetical protein